MDSKNIEKTSHQKESAQKYVDGSLSVLNETLEKQSEKISEVVGERSNEGGGGSFQDEKKTNPAQKALEGVSTISHKISELLFGQIPNTIPQSRKKQEKHIHKALRKEQKRLLKKAEKIINQRHFSASKLEKTMRQLRRVQKLMSNLVYMAVEQLKDLYRKYVLVKR